VALNQRTGEVSQVDLSVGINPTASQKMNHRFDSGRKEKSTATAEFLRLMLH
jgi:hypothetical protein